MRGWRLRERSWGRGHKRADCLLLDLQLHVLQQSKQGVLVKRECLIWLDDVGVLGPAPTLGSLGRCCCTGCRSLPGLDTGVQAQAGHA